MRRPALLLLSPLLIATAIPGCRPDLGDRESLVESTRILAVRGDPPESAPGADVAYRILVASAAGTIESPPASWAFCAEPKPLTESNVVNGSCLKDAVRPLGGPSAAMTAATPTDACALFGPDAPAGSAPADALRPRDPDITGGYYQPLRVALPEVTAVALERVRCNLANAPVEIVKQYTARYLPNQNPTLTPLEASVNGQPVPLDSVPAGAEVRLTVGWGAGDAEAFPVFEAAAQALSDHRESLRVSWFATAGVFESDRTGREEGDPATTTENGWTAPEEGEAHLWVVLRDSRGGVDFAEYGVVIAP